MFGVLGTILGWILWVVWVIFYYLFKFLLYLFAILLFLLWKHQGALLYMRHAPQRKRQIAYNDHPRVRSPAHYNIPFEDFFVETKDKVSIHCWLLRQGTIDGKPTSSPSHASKKSFSKSKSPNSSSSQSKNSLSCDNPDASSAAQGDNLKNSKTAKNGSKSSKNSKNSKNSTNSQNSHNGDAVDSEEECMESCKYATIVLFHGNAGNIGYRLPNAYAMYRYLRCNVVLVDYRGYGNSEGVPTEDGIIYDCEAVLARLCNSDDIGKFIDPSKIFVFGRSLGGAVAIDLAYRYCCDTMVQCRRIGAARPRDFGRNGRNGGGWMRYIKNIKNVWNNRRNGRANGAMTSNMQSIKTMKSMQKGGKSAGNGAKGSNGNNGNGAENEALIGKDANKMNEMDGMDGMDGVEMGQGGNKKDCEWERRPEVRIAGVIVENTFTSILDMVFVLIEQTVQGLTGKGAERQDGSNGSNGGAGGATGDLGELSEKNVILRYLRLFLKYFITNRWQSIDKIGEISSPILFLSGLKDELIPPAHMRKLHQKCNKSEMKLLRTYATGDHNSTWQRGGAQYYEDIQEFVALVLSRSQG